MIFRSKKKSGMGEGYWKASLLGIHLVTCTFVGLLIGYFLDRWLGTEPWFLLAFLLFGIAAGFKNMYVEVKKIQETEKKKEQEEDERLG
ncbi:AtpZ/AtpI family protein [Desulfonatronospira sp.]|uniref:AtpZ/AtpI family protein n=1 Tax=Desulfonatronospira sp. TaxID=1962951 RepID=UPI0025C3B341|nr:AtpZ/AtpI family protein [Desulfonatronospira sp.]